MSRSPAPAGAPQAALQEAARDLTAWLVDDALPLWASVGVDHLGGGFFEQISLAGRPVEMARRTRVVARQVYVFATAAARGWMPRARAEALVDHGLRFLLGRLRLPAGHFATSVQADGRGVDARFDLYEQAFVLFALASAHAGRADRDALLRREALALLAALRRGWAHPEAGFEEAVPRALPLRANPHMHLLEAALAWIAVSTGEQREPWQTLADELAGLCLRRFVNADTGAVHEHFDGDWQPLSGAAGQWTEPGHQFEWAWLLTRWAGGHPGTASHGHDPTQTHAHAHTHTHTTQTQTKTQTEAQAFAAARRMREQAERHGIDAARGVAVNALGVGFAPVDGSARIWPQTERIKAWRVALTDGADSAQEVKTAQAAHAERHLGAAIEGLSRYRLAAPRGLWHEVMRTDGGFERQDVKASSLYHIVCAIDDLQQAFP